MVTRALVSSVLSTSVTFRPCNIETAVPPSVKVYDKPLGAMTGASLTAVTGTVMVLGKLFRRASMGSTTT